MDNIPLDVIRYELFPFLDFESRVNLNQCLPPRDRVPKKFDKAFLEAHERDICISMIRSYLTSIEDMPSGDKKFKRIKKMYKLMQTPTYMSFINKHASFRAAVVNKVIEMRTAATYYDVRGSLEAKVALIKEAKKLHAMLI